LTFITDNIGSRQRFLTNSVSRCLRVTVASPRRALLTELAVQWVPQQALELAHRLAAACRQHRSVQHFLTHDRFG
jgi:hypothetical protein